MTHNNNKIVKSRYRYIKVARPEVSAIGHLPVDSDLCIYIGANDAYVRGLRSELKNLVRFVSVSDALNFVSSGTVPEMQVRGIFLENALLEKKEQALMGRMMRSSACTVAALMGNARGLSNEALAQVRSAGLFDAVLDFQVEQAILADKLKELCRIREICDRNKDSIKVESYARQVYGRRYLGKRILDIFLASVSIILALPVMIFVAVAIKLESRGPIFYNSNRAGRGYRIFKFYKFRTMKVGADRMIKSISHLNKYNNFGHAPVFFKADHDPRITVLGQFLRTYGLDELPQLFNVLKGDMSIVGNRPLPLYEACALTSDEAAERFSAPSGITGLWQVSCRSEGGQFDCRSRIGKDIEYFFSEGLWLDFRIMLKTPVVLMRRTKSRIKVMRGIRPLIAVEPELLKMH